MIAKLSFSSKIPQPVRMSEKVAVLLASEIQKGTFCVGDKLPSESELSSHFGVSRTVIREALSKLKYDGLLESKQGFGAWVARADKKRAFRLDGVDDTTDVEFKHVYELRAIIEADAAFLAAKRRKPSHLDQMEKCLDAMADAIEKSADGTAPDMDFHNLVAEASNNPYLSELMVFLSDKLRVAIRKARDHTSLKPGLPLVVQKEHVEIFNGILSKDPEAARAAIMSHLTNAGRRLEIEIMGAE